MEKNDYFFVIFAIPSIVGFALGTYVASLWYLFYISMGVAMYGLAYFMVHDILIHQRFKLFTRIDNFYFRAIRKAHKIHHKHLGKQEGECFGMLWVPVKYFKEALKKIVLMSKEFTYLLVDLGCIIVPFLFSFHPQLKFTREWRNFVLPCIITALFFLVWDAWFTQIGIWSFNPEYVVGVYLWGLPIEEILFFVCIPYACVFTYHCLTLLIDNSFDYEKFSWLFRVMILGLLTIALLNLAKLYTSITFILLAFFLSYLLYKRKSFLSVFFISYLLILPFFFISNGILTGSFIDAPVVMYNNDHNLNIRLFTIPLEDVFYGMLLLLMNVSGFEYLKSRRIKNISVLKY